MHSYLIFNLVLKAIYRISPLYKMFVYDCQVKEIAF